MFTVMYIMEIVLILIVINVAIFILPYVVNFIGPFDSSTNFLMMFWHESTKVFNGEYYRLITSQFLHGSAPHIFFNMYTLWGLRGYIENFTTLFGKIRFPINNNFLFILVYLLSGIGGNLLSMCFSRNPSVGASGALLGIFGFLTGYALTFNVTSLINELIINFFLLIAIGLLIPNINNWAHAGGFMTGFALYYFCLIFVRI